MRGFFGEFLELGRPADRRLGEVDGELIYSLYTIREDIMSWCLFRKRFDRDSRPRLLA